ncbi:MAG: hypothetical protein Q9160_004827 [Pyrenula sp. 1 TL-2023]
MNRLFGSGSQRPKANLDDAISSIETRIESIDVKIKAFDSELATLTQKMNKMRDGPGKSAMKARALKVLRQRKQYDSQRDQLQQQVFNMEQTRMMQANLHHTVTTMEVLRTSTKEASKQTKALEKIDHDKLADDMADALEAQNNINESLSRAYNVPDGVEDYDLDAELEALGEEVIWEQEQGIGQGDMPSYMQDEVPQFVDEPPETGKVKEAAGGIG